MASKHTLKTLADKTIWGTALPSVDTGGDVTAVAAYDNTNTITTAIARANPRNPLT